MLKIAIVGPESSGKTTLAGELAVLFGAVLVPEVARSFLQARSRPYTEPDLSIIARSQVEQEEWTLAGSDVPIMVCDTDLITIRIWSEEKYGRCDPWIVAQSEVRHYDLWMLCMPDIPWEADPLRENPYDRDRLFSVYRDHLERSGKPYIVVRGGRADRLRTATEAIHQLLADRMIG